MSAARRLALPAALASALLLVGCTGEDDPEDGTGGPTPVRLDWTEARLPPAAAGERVAVRDVAECGDRWLAVGALLGEDGSSRPAAWESTDGTTWSALAFRARTHYGRQAILLSVACRDGVPVAVGAKSGGAHGNPRVTTFRPVGARVWTDVEAPFEQYGGPSAVNVGQVAAGPPGWLISGNRTSGPAVWTGRSPRVFALRERVPGLANSGDLRALAQDATWDGSGWMIVGGGTGADALNGRPQAWRSADGRRWVREEVPDTEEYDDLEGVAVLDDAVVAVGLHGAGFGGWIREDGEWRWGAAFGRSGEGNAASYVVSIASGPAGLLTTVSDGASYGLWSSPDGLAWSPAAVPLAPTTTGDHTLVVAATKGRVLLAADDGSGARIWSAPWPAE